jgi:precorrin-6B methylase 2
MWQAAYRKVRRLLVKEPKKILLLGLGAGGEISMMQSLFPGAAITVVEHDPEMIKLAEELRLYGRSPLITTVEGDAREALSSLTERFDIITVDLFRGAIPSPLLGDHAFLDQLAERLAERGVLLVNVYHHVAYLSEFQKRFLQPNIWKFVDSTLGLFRASDRDMVRALPDGFVPVTNWPEFDFMASIPRLLNPEKLGGVAPGTRWTLWPLSFEQYVSDTEPITHPHQKGLMRITIWRRLTWDDAPPGWRARAFPAQTIGFSEFTRGKPYFTAWSESARRNRREWLEKYRGAIYHVRPLSFEEFIRAHQASRNEKSTQLSILETDLYPRYKKNKNAITFWGVERLVDGRILAGIAVIDSPIHCGSYYLAGFHTHEAGKDPVTVGLFDHWSEESEKKGLRFLHFGDFWQPGKPESWKGFSNFKAKFGPRYLVQPPVLYRFEW